MDRLAVKIPRAKITTDLLLLWTAAIRVRFTPLDLIIWKAIWKRDPVAIRLDWKRDSDFRSGDRACREILYYMGKTVCYHPSIVYYGRGYVVKGQTGGPGNSILRHYDVVYYNRRKGQASDAIIPLTLWTLLSNFRLAKVKYFC